MSGNNKLVSIFLCGVGGQGVVTLGDVIARLAFNAGLEVKKNEIHGLSRRSGSVSSHVKYGSEVFTPIIGDGKADFLVALEELEALRKAHKVKPDGLILVNKQRILPSSCMTGGRDYPQDIEERLGEYAKVERVPAFDTARELGNPRAVNIAMAGAVSRHMEFEKEKWEEAIGNCFKGEVLDLNLKAFEIGRSGIAE